MKYLKLNLSGVLQYFSADDAIALRKTYTTSLYPTSKAINGLICSALGYKRNDPRSNELYKKLDFKYNIISNPIILNDFQTIKPLKSQAYYMNKQNKSNKFTTVSGSQRDGQLIKNVQYIQNAEFNVYIGSESEDLLLEIYNAILNPVYSLFIGKRSCIPNKPIVTSFELFDKEDLKDVYNCA